MSPANSDEAAIDRRGEIARAALAALALHAIARALLRQPADAAVIASALPAVYGSTALLGDGTKTRAAQLCWTVYPALVLLWLAGANTLGAIAALVAIAVRAWSLYPTARHRLQQGLYLALTITAIILLLNAGDELAPGTAWARLPLRSGSRLFVGEQSLGRGSEPLRIAGDGPMRGVALISAAANAAGLGDGTAIAEIRRGGRSVATIKLGADTAEWSWDRPDLRGRCAHRKADVYRTLLERDDRGQLFPTRTYGAALRFVDDPGAGVIEIVVIAPPPVTLVVHELRTLRW